MDDGNERLVAFVLSIPLAIFHLDDNTGSTCVRASQSTFSRRIWQVSKELSWLRQCSLPSDSHPR